MSNDQPITPAQLLPVLRTQRELLTPRTAWVQHFYKAGTDAEPQYCMVGALMAAAQHCARAPSAGVALRTDAAGDKRGDWQTGQAQYAQASGGTTQRRQPVAAGAGGAGAPEDDIPF